MVKVPGSCTTLPVAQSIPLKDTDWQSSRGAAALARAGFRVLRQFLQAAAGARWYAIGK